MLAYRVQQVRLHFPTAGVAHVFDRLPGLESSHINTQREDELYDAMMLSLLRIVLRPLRQLCDTPAAHDSVFRLGAAESAPQTAESLNNQYETVRGGWEFVKGQSDTHELDCRADPAAVVGNLLNWVAFTKKNRSQVAV